MSHSRHGNSSIYINISSSAPLDMFIPGSVMLY